MLLIPSINAIPEMRDNRGFSNISHPTKKKITTINRKGNARPKKEINHQVRGLR